VEGSHPLTPWANPLLTKAMNEDEPNVLVVPPSPHLAMNHE
jgi:hypothetical protein